MTISKLRNILGLVAVTTLLLVGLGVTTLAHVASSHNETHCPSHCVADSFASISAVVPSLDQLDTDLVPTASSILPLVLLSFAVALLARPNILGPPLFKLQVRYLI